MTTNVLVPLGGRSEASAVLPLAPSAGARHRRLPYADAGVVHADLDPHERDQFQRTLHHPFPLVPLTRIAHS